MLELVMLGTAASAPSIQRGLPSQVVLWRDERFLVDCGEGTQRQILRSGIGFRRLQRVLLTHGHLDHILGLGGLISTFARWEAVETFKAQELANFNYFAHQSQVAPDYYWPNELARNVFGYPLAATVPAGGFTIDFKLTSK